MIRQQELLEILDANIVELAQLELAAHDEKQQADDSYVVTDGLSADRTQYNVLGDYYPDMISPTGETVGFRVQRLENYLGVHKFTLDEATSIANKTGNGSFALSYKVWLLTEQNSMRTFAEAFRDTAARVRSRLGLPEVPGIADEVKPAEAIVAENAAKGDV